MNLNLLLNIIVLGLLWLLEYRTEDDRFFVLFGSLWLTFETVVDMIWMDIPRAATDAAYAAAWWWLYFKRRPPRKKKPSRVAGMVKVIAGRLKVVPAPSNAFTAHERRNDG